MKLHELLEKRAAAVSEMRALADKAEIEKRDLSSDEDSRFGALKTEIADLDRKIGRAQTLAEAERSAPADLIEGRGGSPDLSRYSVARALRCAAAGRLDGLEGEVHAELSRGREVRGNIMVPTTVLLGERRAQIVGSGPAGGYTVATNVAAIADRFRPALLVESMGATVLRDLTGFLDLPKLSESGSTHWIGENQATTRSEVTFAKVTMGPKTVSAEYELSRRIMLQSGAGIEELLRRDLGFLLAQALDSAAINGDGVLAPAGLLHSVWGIEKVTTESLLSDTTANLIAALELDDVMNTGAFLTSAKVWKAVMKVKEGTTNRVIPASEIFHGRRAERTNQVPDNVGSGGTKSALIYAAWSEMVIGYWSAVDIMLNPYHSDVASKGGALLHAFLDADVALRHPEAFAWAEIT
jgi:HK97 family phage major capsid protein